MFALKISGRNIFFSFLLFVVSFSTSLAFDVKDTIEGRVVLKFLSDSSISSERVVKIFDITNVKQQEFFEEYQGSKSKVTLMYHCSSLTCRLGLQSYAAIFCDSGDCGTCRIASDTHRLKFCRGGNFGKGLYFADHFTPTMFDYLSRFSNGPLRPILLTQVKLGSIADVVNNDKLSEYRESSQSKARFGLTSAPIGYDSIKNHWEHVIYNEAAALPRYIALLGPDFSEWLTNQKVIMKKYEQVDGIVYPMQIEDDLKAGVLINSSGLYRLYPIGSTIKPETNYKFTIWGHDTSETAHIYVSKKPSNRSIIETDEVAWVQHGSPKLPLKGYEPVTITFNSGKLFDHMGWVLGVLRAKSKALPGQMNILSYSVIELK